MSAVFFCYEPWTSVTAIYSFFPALAVFFHTPCLFYVLFLSLSLTHRDCVFINVKFLRAEIIALILHEVWDADSFDTC